jgi:hypothetical protein
MGWTTWIKEREKIEHIRVGQFAIPSGSFVATRIAVSVKPHT